MANNLIQIKRSLSTANPTSLANGELAFTANGDVLFIGSNSAVVAIGGKRNPGVLTANQALVANATSGIDKVVVANLVASQIYANGTFGSAGQLLATSGSSANAYWIDPATLTTAAAGANQQVQFNANGAFGASAGLTFNNSTNTLSVSNTLLVTNNINAASHTVGSALIANSTGLFTTGTVNASVHSVGSDVIANSTGVFTTGTVNATVVSTTAFRANTTVIAIANTAGLLANNSLGTDGQVLHSNGSAVYWDTDTDTTYDLSAVANTNANEGIIRLTSSGNANDDVKVSGTGSVVVSSNATHIIIGSNGDISSVVAGDGLTGGGTSGDVTLNVGAGNGITVAADSISVDGANGISVDSSGVNVQAGTNGGLSVNTTGVWVVGGTGVTVNSTGVSIGQAVSTTSNVTFANVVTTDLTVDGNTVLGSNTQDIITVNALITGSLNPTANVTYDVGTNLMRWREGHFANLHSTDGYFDGNVQISGNLVVTGDVLTVNVSTLAVEDSLIQLASNNTASDLLDIGFYGNYDSGGAPHEHAGLFRDASDNGVFKLFLGLTEAPTTTVNTAGAGYTTGTLQSYLLSGGLVSNGTNISITANSTLDVAITANTLTLHTPLEAASGGTGHNVFTNQDILVASNTTYLSKLSLGTSGYVLQSNGTALVYDTLDGGTF